jgi:hypothetical protein
MVAAVIGIAESMPKSRRLRDPHFGWGRPREPIQQPAAQLGRAPLSVLRPVRGDEQSAVGVPHRCGTVVFAGRPGYRTDCLQHEAACGGSGHFGELCSEQFRHFRLVFRPKGVQSGVRRWVWGGG